MWLEWKFAAGLSAILLYFLLLSHHGLRSYFNGDDVMNLVGLHGYWRWPWWWSAVHALLVVTPVYRPMGDVFYRSLYGIFGFHPLPFRAACFALMVLNLGLFLGLAFKLSHSRKIALLSTLIFSFHAALSDLYFSTGTVYDILCVCFTLAAFLTYVSVRSRGRELHARHIVIFLLFYGGALDSKEMAASLPLALILYEVILAPRVPSARWRRALPVLLSGALTMAALAAKIPSLSDNPLYRPRYSPTYLLNNVSHYLGMLVFLEQPLGAVWLLVLAGLAVIACVAMRRPVALFGLFYGFLALLPVAAVPVRDGFVLYLPLVGFALFCGDVLAAAVPPAPRFLPHGARRSLWLSLSQAGMFGMIAGVLFVVHSRHWRDQSQQTWRENLAMREIVRGMLAWRPKLPVSTRLFFLDDPLPRNHFSLPFLMQAAYHDPSICVERQKNFPTPIDPAEYEIFDYLVSLRDGKLEARRLPPIRWEVPAVRVTFYPGTVDPGQSLQMRVGTYSNAAVDIQYRTVWRFAQVDGVALRWTALNAAGVATIPLPHLTEPAKIQITAVRVSGGTWRKALGGFVVR